MIQQNLRVGRTVGEGHSRATDVAGLRKALRKTGHSRPAPQPSGIYDRSVYDSVMRFQRDFGLEEDGIVRPGGPTQTAINVAHAALETGGRDGYEAVRKPFAALHGVGFRYRPDESDPRAAGRWSDPEGRPVSPDQVQSLLHEVEKSGSGTQLAMSPGRDPITGQRRFPGQRGGILEGGGGGGGGRGNLPAGELFKGLFRHLFGESAKKSGETGESPEKPTPSGRTVPPDNPPRQIPPSPAEPPPEPERGKGRPEPEEQLPTVLPGARPVENRPGLFIFPDQPEVFNKPQIVRHKGGEKTRDYNEEVRDWFLTPEKEAEGWEHVGGGRERPDGSGKTPRERELEEEFIPNPVKDFEEEKIKGKVDGRPGSKYVDLTFHNKKTGKWLRIQTVDMDKNGIPTQREQENADKIMKRAKGDLLLIPKPRQ